MRRALSGVFPAAKTLESSPGVSWGRVSACSDWAVTSNFARGQLEPLLCRHHAVRHKGQVQWLPSYVTFHHDLVEMAVGILGDAASGGHPTMVTDLLDPLNSKELSQRVPSAEVCAFWT